MRVPADKRPVSSSSDETEDLREQPAPPVGTGIVVFAIHAGGTVARLFPGDRRIAIGRDEASDVRIDDASVSRHHAWLDVSGGALLLTDLGSRNGTRVGGARLAEGVPVEVAPGALALVGSVSLTVQRVGDLTQLGRLSESPASRGVAAKAIPAGDHELLCSGSLARLVEIVDRVASDTLSVLLLGETGVGKDVFAEMIHARSNRAKGPFVRLHCAAFTETLIESEIFGHERGAFTGANRSKPGLLEEADGGTVFIDEIGELPMSVQVKLLRVLEDRRVMRIGSTKAARIDVRFVGATNRDVEAEIAEGTFRRDLFYRIAGIALVIPPLRERRDEIPALASAFLSRAARDRKMRAPPIDPAALRALVAHDWPGNVRELKNAMERALLMSSAATVGVADLQLGAGASRPVAAPGVAADALEARELSAEARSILDALAKAGGNQTAAAKLLGISRRTLINRLVDYDLPRPRKR